MKLARYTWLFLCGICLVSQQSSGQAVSGKADDPVSSLPYDSSRIAVLRYDSTVHWPFDSTNHSAQLEAGDFRRLDSLISKAIVLYNLTVDSSQWKYSAIDTNRFNYKRQYLPVIDSKGHKLVFANFFCRHYDRDWKTRLFVVDDGGNCYFSMIVNLNTAEVKRLSVNGYAGFL